MIAALALGITICYIPILKCHLFTWNRFLLPNDQHSCSSIIKPKVKWLYLSLSLAYTPDWTLFLALCSKWAFNFPTSGLRTCKINTCYCQSGMFHSNYPAGKWCFIYSAFCYGIMAIQPTSNNLFHLTSSSSYESFTQKEAYCTFGNSAYSILLI